MIRLTQADLLNEGLWNTIKGGGRLAGGIGAGAVKGIAKTLDYVAPELTAPIHKVDSGIRDIASTTYQTMKDIWKGRERKIIDDLRDVGYIVSDPGKIKKEGKNYIVPAQKITDYDASGKPILDKKPSPFLVDPYGRIIKNLRNAKVSPTLS